jgi:hypothetical protein
MKIRILMLSLLGLIFFNSCSSDSDSSNPTTQNLDPNTILPKKIIRGDSSGEFITYDFFYNQSKLDHIHYVSLNNGPDVEFDINFTYNGNLISEVEVIDNSGQIVSNIAFTYQNNKLVNKLITNVDYVFNIGYSYDSSNNIITRTFTSPGSVEVETDTLTIINNLVYSESDISYSTTPSPFKNITGIRDAFIENGTEYDYTSSFDNLQYIFFSTTKNILEDGSLYFVYVYNDIEFPTTINCYGGYPGTSYSIFYQ